jgi:hypothetical protein
MRRALLGLGIVALTLLAPTAPAAFADTVCEVPTAMGGFTGDPSSTDANHPTTQLTAQLNHPFCPGDHATITDDTTQTVLYDHIAGPEGGEQSQFGILATLGNLEEHSYTAALNGVSRTTTVKDQGWIGSVSLTTDHESLDAAHESAYITIHLDRQLDGPYVLALYNSVGQRIWVQAAGPTTLTYDIPVQVPSDTSETYMAVVALNAPEADFPGPSGFSGESAFGSAASGAVGRAS